MTQWLADILKHTSIKVSFIADDSYTPNADSFISRLLKSKLFYGIRYKKNGIWPVELNTADKWPQVDVVVVTSYNKYETIKKTLAKQKTISVTELIVS